MKRLLVLATMLLILVSIHSFFQWRRAEDATEMAARAISISERMAKTNSILFDTASSCSHILANTTLEAQSRVVAILDTPKPPQRKSARVAFNAAHSPRK